MADASPFTKFVPGFDFLQGLVKNAGSAMPAMGQWIAPTLNPEELEKRIEELRTVQFWLEQNARMLGATIQALEVQRMTLATLKTMNVSFGELAESMKIKPASPPPAPPLRPTPPAPTPPAPVRDEAPADEADEDTAPAPDAPGASPRPEPGGAATASTTGAVDPMQWWGALTRQFTELTAAALKDGPAEAAQRAGVLVRDSVDATAQTLRSGLPKVASPQPTAARKAGRSAPKPAAPRKAAARSGRAAPAPARKRSKP